MSGGINAFISRLPEIDCQKPDEGVRIALGFFHLTCDIRDAAYTSLFC
jgi:hypothetical protein